MSARMGEIAEDRKREREAEAEMQRLLDMLPVVGDDGTMHVEELDIPDLDMGAWEFGAGASVSLGTEVF